MRTLRAEGLVKSYRSRTVVKGVNLEVRQGEIVGLLGPNGAGKTTSFYMIVGLARPDGGRVLLDDEEITTLPMYLRARKGINYLPQEASVFRKLTVAENVLAVLENMPYSKSERLEAMERLLNDLGVAHLAGNRAHSLSGGERRRVEICRALATEPSFVLLDEPFAGIDPIAVMDIQKLCAILKARSIGILITDHNVQETLEITDRAYIISAGEILEEGTPAQIAASERARTIYLGERFQLAPGGGA
jgi:lipopolysaccharide export system ATP-binding protein